MIETFRAEETFALGKKIGEAIRPGTIISLVGDLRRAWLRDLESMNQSTALPLQLCRFMRMEDCRFIILMYIELVILRRWMRLDMRTISMEKASA